MSKLLIVESPNKCDKIAGYLGAGWTVAASYGHVRDLPPKEIGVAGPDYWPDYVTGEKSAGTIAKLRKLASGADEIWLATDPDREGEAIAWHLEQILGRGKTCRRVTFNEITAQAIKKAVSSPRSVDKRLFLAQQGRRVLDRLYGYKVSPILGNKLGQSRLSAGRVQSVALRLIVEREEAIRAFMKTNHFGVLIELLDADTAGVWTARWDTSPLVTDDHPYITDRRIAEAVLASARQGVTVKAFDEKQQLRRPYGPFTTSTLQQAASNMLKMSVEETMKAAQTLFEAGLITYHRTDNPNLSQDGVDLIWALLRERSMDAYIPDKPNTWKAKADAQEAHEAIRPTDFRVYKTPNSGNSQYDQLYRMIWQRAVASQMKAAVFKVRTAQLETDAPVSVINTQALFTARGEEMIFDGWLRLMKGDVADDTAKEDEDNHKQRLPVLTVGSRHTPQDGNVLEQETKPPSRFSEPGLVRALEREGIGRPSTYASIISTLQKRNYVHMTKRLFEPTPLGEAIVQGLRGRFHFMEVAYTKEMEDQLDRIAEGKADYKSVVGHYDRELDGQLDVFIQDNSIAAMPGATDETHPCPNCEDGRLRRIKGKNGYFWGCSNYKREGNPCQTTLPDTKGKPGKREEASEEHPCPNCEDGRLRRIKGGNGYFWGCSNYKREDNPCKTTLPDVKGKPGKAPEKSDDHPCPTCGKGHLQRRAGKEKGTFWWGCDQYPACKHTAPDHDGKPGVWGDRGGSGTSKATGGKRYPCGACETGYLVKRTGSKGVFWGCSNYRNGCRHTEQDKGGKPQFAAS